MTVGRGVDKNANRSLFTCWRCTCERMNTSQDIPLGLSYDDVLLEPKRSRVRSRTDVDTSVSLFAGVGLETPVISANMDTVTEAEMAQAMADAGGCGIIHRFTTIEDQESQIASVKGVVGGCVGIDGDFIENAQRLVSSGADFICVDVAHGHMERCIQAVDELTSSLSVPVMAGNVATGKAAVDLVKAGAESIKVGVGPGSVCQTREVAGVGVPQFTAVQRVSSALDKYELMKATEVDDSPAVSIVADGGITKSGDTAKALMAGADAVMCGSLLAGTDESPGTVIESNGSKFKLIRGMASEAARKDNPLSEFDGDSQRAIEGVEGLREYVGPVESFIADHMKGVRSGLSYCGGSNIAEARENASFIQVTNSTISRNGSHGVHSK